MESRPAGKLLVDLGLLSPTEAELEPMEDVLGPVDFPGSPCVVLFAAPPPFPAALFCCAVALATGNANKPAVSSIQREIETMAVPPLIEPSLHTWRRRSVKRAMRPPAAQHHAESTVGFSVLKHVQVRDAIDASREGL